MATTVFEDKIKVWAFPSLIGIISFFMVSLMNRIDKIHADVQMVKETVIEVKIDTRYSKETIEDHSQRLRALENFIVAPSDNTRVKYEFYTN